MNPILCGFDIETSGLDKEKDHITEIGYVIKKWRDPKPLAVVSEFVQAAPDLELTPEITAITKITADHLTKGGKPFVDVLHRFMDHLMGLNVDYIVAHNGEGFDKPFLTAYARRLGCGSLNMPEWLDTMTDIDYPREFASTNLTYVSASLGFLNSFPHAAVFDAFTTLKVAECFKIEDIIARHHQPWVVVRALVKAPFHDDAPAGEKETDKAKARRYRWQDCGANRIYEKCWVKRIKEGELEAEIAEAPFKVVRIDK